MPAPFHAPCETVKQMLLLVLFACCSSRVSVGADSTQVSNSASGSSTFIEATAPPSAPGPSPLTGEQEATTFSLPPGFLIELIAKESDGIGKFVAVDWDLRGNL